MRDFVVEQFGGLDMNYEAAAVIFFSLFLIPTKGFSQDSPDSNDGVVNQGLQLSDESMPVESKPYEIVITPTVTRTDLRGLIQTVEDDFFSRFNELNIDENYDIYCYKHTPIMSHISERVCEPLFLRRARGENSSETLFLLGSASKDAVNQSSGSANFLTPDVMRRDKRKDFETLQEKMEELNQTDEELRSIGSVLAQLKARLEKFGKEDR